MLKRIEAKLETIEKKLDELIGQKKRLETIDTATLVSLPNHLQKTLVVVSNLRRVNADDVAKETGKARAIESSYLNQLARMGYIKKESSPTYKRGKQKQYFISLTSLT
jgi:hypothetical protein